MSAHGTLILVRLIHVLAGSLWVGGAGLVAGFIAPAIRAAGTAGAPVMRQLTAVRRLPHVLLVSGVLALASGGYLMLVVSNGAFAVWIRSGAGATYTIGAISALLAAVIGIGINIPTAMRLGRLAETQNSAAASALAQGFALARRLALGTRPVAILVVIAASAMAVARYV